MFHFLANLKKKTHKPVFFLGVFFFFFFWAGFFNCSPAVYTFQAALTEGILVMCALIYKEWEKEREKYYNMWTLCVRN